MAKVDKNALKESSKQKSNSALYLTLALFVVIIIVALVLIFSYSRGSMSGNVVREDFQSGSQQAQQSCRDVQVPYDYLEEYQETVPYTDRVCEQQTLVYKKDTGSCQQRRDNFFSADEPAKYDCTITNLDSEAGTFSIRIGFNVNGQQLEETQSRYIYPQSSEKFVFERDAKVDACYCYETDIPTKQICRDVTQYREVTKTRTVTRYRIEQNCD